jgi:hypothetical protein
MALTSDEIQTAAKVRQALSVITLVTCLLLIGVIVLFQKYRFPNTRMVLWMTCVATLQALGYLIPFNQKNDGVCDFQAVWISFCDWAFALWIIVIAFNLHQMVVLGKKNTTSYEKFYHAFVWGVAFIVSLLPFLGGVEIYGPAGAW